MIAAAVRRVAAARAAAALLARLWVLVVLESLDEMTRSGPSGRLVDLSAVSNDKQHVGRRRSRGSHPHSSNYKPYNKQPAYSEKLIDYKLGGAYCGPL
eukprot:2619608-Prymnesium_polylepis.1